jgi:hypothetical protein
MNNISIKHPKRVIAISVCVVIALCGATITFCAINKNDNIVHLKRSAVQSSWSSDPTDIENVESRSEVIAKVRYTGKKYSYKLPTTFISTAYTVDILEVLKGNLDNKQIEISAEGGIVSLKEWNDNSTGDEKYSSDEYKTMSDEELEASTVEYDAENGVNLQEGDVTTVFLRYVDGTYYILFGGLSLFEQKPNGDFANPELSSVVIDTATINEIKANNLNPATDGT